MCLNLCEGNVCSMKHVLREEQHTADQVTHQNGGRQSLILKEKNTRQKSNCVQGDGSALKGICLPVIYSTSKQLPNLFILNRQCQNKSSKVTETGMSEEKE